MAKINDIFNWCIQSGFLIIVIAFLWGNLRPLLNAKIKTAKTERERANWALLERVADQAVTSLVGRNELSGSDKFTAAKQQAQASLEKAGVKMTGQAVDTAVQAAYEKNPLTPTVEPAAKATAPTQSHEGLVENDG